MNPRDFETYAEQALQDLSRRLMKAGDQYGFEADFQAGALIVEFEEPPAKFVVSSNSPVSQIWISANVKSQKLDWDVALGAFCNKATGETLVEVMAGAISEHLGENVKL